MKNQFIFTDSLEEEKKILKTITDANPQYFISLQDQRIQDCETVYVEHPISKEMYDYYFIHFIRLWGKRITFKSLDGTIVSGFLNSLSAK